MSIEALAAAVKPWNDVYAQSKLVSGSVTFLHIGGLLVAGGLAIASDRAVLRARAAAFRRHVLDELAGVHGAVLFALAVVFASGVAMALADVGTFIVSLVFWTKMAFVVGLLANGWLLRRTASQLRADDGGGDGARWRRLRLGATASISLWILTTALGVAVMSS